MKDSTTVLKKLFGSKYIKLPGGWKRLHIGERHDFRPQQTLFGISYRGVRGDQGFGYLRKTEKEPIYCLWGTLMKRGPLERNKIRCLDNIKMYLK